MVQRLRTAGVCPLPNGPPQSRLHPKLTTSTPGLIQRRCDANPHPTVPLLQPPLRPPTSSGSNPLSDWPKQGIIPS
ncbi:unnamed protein product [Arctogadus glacialis]